MRETKASLKAELAQARKEVADEIALNSKLRNRLVGAHMATAAARQERDMTERRFKELGLFAYVANSSPGTPTCVSGDGGSDDDLSVELYLHEGALLGVRVTQQGDTVAGYGLVAFDPQDSAGL